MLTNSLRNLSYNKNLTSAVFWGKIYGTKNDYYIAEVTGGEYPEAVNPEPDQEKRGEDGVNKNVYFVATSLTGEWVELPDVRPSLLIASRKIRYIFSGELNKKICTNPHFAGKEIDYLRCQIARVNHGTHIVPNVNSYTFDKEAQYKPLEPNTEAKPLKHNDYLVMKNWIHYLPGILKEGRINHFDREPPKEDMDKEVFMKSIIQADPFDNRMQSITEDRNLFSLIPSVKIPSWKMQYVYDDKIYINPEILKNEDPDAEQKDNTVNYTILCLRSLRWPGSYTVRAKNQLFRFYFGWGQKFAEYSMGQTFVYEHFPSIPNDPDDVTEFPEPNFPPEQLEVKENAQPQDDDS
jgi:radial spoke head protein 4A